MLQDPRVISSIWSDAETVNNEVFNHLHIKFNMQDEKLSIETAAKDFQGQPVKKAFAPITPPPPQPVHNELYKIQGEYDIMTNGPLPLPTQPVMYQPQ